MQKKLKKCPFCGLDAAYITKNVCLSNGYVSYSLYHTTVTCILDSWHDLNVFRTEEEAVDAWNCRKLHEPAE